MHDCREQSENELSIIVFNDKNLYRKRHSIYFFEIIEECFLYTKEQLEILKQDLKDDLED